MVETVSLSEAAIKARKRRNVWLAFALLGIIVLIMTVTMVRLSEATHQEAERRAAEGLLPSPAQQPSEDQ